MVDTIVLMALVFFMTPGLAFFYAGLLHSKNATAMMYQNFVSITVTTVLWWAFGWSMALGGKSLGGFMGDFTVAFYGAGAGFVGDTDYAEGTKAIETGPDSINAMYQLMFCIITPILMTGAFANRITLKAWVVFLIFWQILIYFPLCHWVWYAGDTAKDADDIGFLAKWNVKDFAGGIVVHTSAGFGCLAMILFLGKRVVNDCVHSMPLVALGTAMLWFGWFGFNGAGEDSGPGISNTHFAASAGAGVWVLLEMIIGKSKASFVGYCTGAIAGLATITPHAPWVTPSEAMFTGAFAGAWCWGMVKVKEAMKWDDALDVWAVHGMGGYIGTILVGLYGEKKYLCGMASGTDCAMENSKDGVTPDGDDADYYGLFSGGNGTLLYKQFVAATFVAIYAFVISYGLLVVITAVMGKGNVIVSEEGQMDLDKHLHDEQTYNNDPIELFETAEAPEKTKADAV